jgi:hypothetical protein
MRWLLICLLVSVAALLLAAAGVARHIYLQRRNLSIKAARMAEIAGAHPVHPAEETEIEP